MTKEIPFESEHALHILTQIHLKELFDLEFVASEIQLNDLRLDNLAFDLKTNSFVIIEYKNEFNENVLNQAQEYCDLLISNQEFFSERLEDKENVDFDNTRVMIIGPKFSQKQIDSAKSNFEIWKVSLFDDGTVTYENMKTNEIKTLNIDLDDLKWTEEYLLEKHPQAKDLYLNLKDRVLREFDDITVKALVIQMAFKTNDRLLCVINFNKSSLNIKLYGDDLDIPQNNDGTYSFKYESDDDSELFLKYFTQVYNQKRA